MNNYLPYSDTDSSGNVTGLVKDYVPKIVEGLGIRDMSVTYKGYDSYDDMISHFLSEAVCSILKRMVSSSRLQ